MEPPAKKTAKMKALTYWDPFRELEDMQHRLSTVLGRQLNRRQDGDKESITVAEWAPVVDIIEDETEYLIRGSPKRGNGVSIVDSSGRGGLAFFVPPRL
jgi:hypothetical protein